MSDKQSSRRFYVVTHKADGAACLVEAATKSGALTRAAASYSDVRIASSGDILQMMKAGCDVIEIPPNTELELPLEA